jgi:hypothetical protein
MPYQLIMIARNGVYAGAISVARSAAVGLKFASVTSVYGVSVRSVQLVLAITTPAATSVTESFEMICRM